MVEMNYNIRDDLNSPIEEAYSALRSNIQFCSYEEKIKSIAITSSYPNEGKTTTAINLSISMAKTGYKTLMVDADLRKPMTVKHLGSKNSLGLSNLLSGRALFDDVINSTNIPNFSFIACGPKPPNPAELLSSSNFCDFLKQATERFDMVIIDTPPLGSVIDCAVIAAQTDGSLIVIASNKVKYRNVLRVKEQLGKANAKVLGVVLNKVKKCDYKSYYNYYNYYQNPRIIGQGWLKRLKTRNSTKDLKKVHA